MNKSDTIGQLAEALSKAQGAMKNAIKDSTNPYFKSKYADLASVSDACRAELSANGLSVVQLPESRDGQFYLSYLLMHTSGEWISGDIEMNPVKSDPQGVGSVITYFRRYTLAAIAGVATEDDDGNAASNNKATVTTDKPVTFTKKSESAAGNPPSGSKGPLAPPAAVTLQQATMEDVKASLIDSNAKPAPSAEPTIERGKQANIHRDFRAAVAEDKKKDADVYFYDWLLRNGFEKDGKPTAAAIPESQWIQTKQAALQYAASL